MKRGIIILLFNALLVFGIQAQVTYTFTNAGAQGSFGPTAAQVANAYSGTSLDGLVTSNSSFQGIQEFIVPATGLYRIQAIGATGGNQNGTNVPVGHPADISGEFELTAGTKLYILVGQHGHLGSTRPGWGGGGGTFVIQDELSSSGVPLVVAGGAGSGHTGVTVISDYQNASLTTSPNFGSQYVVGSASNGGSGAGFLINGDVGNNAIYLPVAGTTSHTIPQAFVNGGVGDVFGGGFGGGGGVTNTYGGGAGGYEGGKGPRSYPYQGGGGASFNGGTNQSNVLSDNNLYTMSHGAVIITEVNVLPPITTTAWRMNRGGGAIQFNIGNGSLGNPIAYGEMQIPSTDDPNWESAPLDGNGDIRFVESSILSTCRAQLDFTYFETYIDIPEGATVDELTVTFAQVDDGARAYIFNSAYPNGAFDGEITINNGVPVSKDYSQFAVAGERNRVVIVQFDSCPVGNNLIGANLNVNGTVVPVDNSAPPVVVTKNITASLDLNGSLTISASDVDNGSFSALAGPVTLSIDRTDFNCADLGTPVQVTLTATDTNGEASTATAMVNVVDEIGPNITAQDVTVNLDASGSATLSVNDVLVSASDACGVQSTSVSPAVFGCADVGVQTVTITATDVNGNESTATAQVTVTNNSEVSVFDQGDYVNNGNSSHLGSGDYRLTANAGGQFGSVWYQNKMDLNSDFNLEFDVYLGNNDGGADGMAFVLQPLSTSAGTGGGGIGYLGISPSFAVEFDTYQNGDRSDPTADHLSLQTNGVINHGTVNNLQGPVSVGNLENGAWHSVNITWNSQTNNFRLDLDGTNRINYSGDVINNVFNGNPGVYWGWTAATGGLSNEQRVRINSLTFTEEFSISSSAIVDASCPANADGSIDIEMSYDSPCTIYSWSNGATTQDISGLLPGIYTVTVSNPGQTDIVQSFTVGNADTQVPQITAPANISLLATSASGGVVNYTTPVGTDNCSVTTTLTAGLASGSTFPIGTTLVTYTATDASGNEASASFTVTVTGLPPQIEVPADITVENDFGICGAIVSYTATETVGIPASTITYDIDPGTLFGVGTTVVTATATNAVGTSTKSFNITVNDTQVPTITSPFDITTNVDAGVCGAVVNYDVPTATDNCGTSAPPTSLAGHTYKGERNGHTYFLSNEKATPEVAHANAIAAGGHLATITDAAENSFISGFIADFMWIGATDRDVEGQWGWITNEPMTYTNWANGEPNNAGAGEDWAVINWGGVNNPSWNDWYYTQPAYYVIEFDGGSLPTTLVSGPAPGDVFPVGTTTVIYEAVDPSGNRVETSFDVTVIDNIAPQVLTNNVTVQLDNNGSAVIMVSDIDAGSSDACGIASYTLSKTAFDCSNVGANTVTLTVTDNNGNVSSGTAIVTVEDNVAPTVLTQNITVELDENGQASISAGGSGSTPTTLFWATSASDQIWSASIDGSGTPTVVYGDATPGGATRGAAAVEYDIASDRLFWTTGNSWHIFEGTADGTAAQTLLSNGSGSIAGGNDDRLGISLDIPNNRYYFSVAFGGGLWYANADNSGSATQFFDPGSAWISALDYDAVNGWVYYNQYGSTGQQGIYRVRPDGTGNMLVHASNGPRGMVVDGTNNKVYWIERGTKTIKVGNADGTGSATTLYTHTLANARDIDLDTSTGNLYWTEFTSGSTSSTDHIVKGNVDGSTSVVLYSGSFGSLKGISIGTGLGSGGNGIDAGSYDNCGIASMSLDVTDFSCADVGENTVSLIVTDVNGNVSIGTATVTVQDNIAPTVATQNITVQLDADGSASITTSDIDNGTYDNCDFTLSLDVDSFSCADVGANTVTLIATDVNGNTSTATAIVTVEDNIAAQVLTQNISIDLDALGNASITTSMIDAGSNDACGIASYALSKTTFDCSNVGANTVTLTVTDVNGNVSSANATVTVNDVTAAEVITQNISIDLDASGNASITTGMIDAGSNDACGIASYTLSQYDFDCSNVGANTVTLTVTDVNGNVSSADATVTVNDVTAAEVITQNVVIQLDANGAASITTSMIDNGSNDACGIASYALSQYDFDCSHVGANTVTLTVTDVNGNVNSADAIVTVEDNIAPILTVPSAITVLNDAGVCGAVIDIGMATATDNCSVASIVNDGLAFYPVGTTTVTWTATDVNGNESSATQLITVTNDIPVINGFSMPESMLINSASMYSAGFTDNNLQSATWDWGDGSTSAGTIDGQTVNGIHSYSATGLYTVTLTIVDACGESDTKVYTYVPIYDPNEGHITGGGFITSLPGDLTTDMGATGKSNYGFQGKYLPNGRLQGNMNFHLNSAGFKFKSESAQWMVIMDDNAIMKGVGTINDIGGYSYVATMVDIDVNNRTPNDRFRIKIYETSTGNVIYDNESGVALDVETLEQIDKGTVVIHRGGKGKAEDSTTTSTTGSGSDDSGTTDDSKGKGKGKKKVETDMPVIGIEAFPNPTSSTATIRFSSDMDGKARVGVFNLNGVQIATLFEGDVLADQNVEVEFNASSVASGVYLVRVNTNGYIRNLKLMVKK
ncbi:MAG: HYR domain-containing protein [Flavobacteriaceae bacterium]|nr:HYR domain-containing protein [Flavobacteriaceae bacterium]